MANKAIITDIKQARIEAVGRELARETFKRRVRGYGLTTAEILYRRPDRPWLLQTYVWQAYDMAPEFPELSRFVGFWTKELEGPLHSITVAHAGLIKPIDFRHVSVFGLH